MGGHYNPFNMNHGAPTDTERHVGDLGNVMANADGTASWSEDDIQIKLTGDTSIVGRSCMIHLLEDDLGEGGDEGSLSTGNAGARMACGQIVQYYKNGAQTILSIFSALVALIFIAQL